jgi:glycosyltransferase involved in cell wall biosynthesis
LSVGSSGPRVAITTDWLTSFGGAERVLEELRKVVPAAPIYTSVHDSSQLPEAWASWPIRTTFLQRLGIPSRYSRALLPLMPAAFAELELSDYDIVLTVSSAYSKNVNVRAGASNICYCLTPPRYLWDLRDAYIRTPISRLATEPMLQWLRARDLRAAEKVTEFMSISEIVARRVQSTYGRESAVVYPPVDTTRFAALTPRPQGYFLVVSRLIRYKRIDLAVEACTQLGRRLLVVGTGPLREALEKAAGPTVEFLGRKSDEDVNELISGCEAFLFPGLEDFGIAPVEAQAAGRPVIGFGVGGVAETVCDGVTGVLFHEQSAESLMQAIERFDRMEFDPGVCRKNAQRFDSSVFRRRMTEVLQAGGAYQGSP